VTSNNELFGCSVMLDTNSSANDERISATRPSSSGTSRYKRPSLRETRSATVSQPASQLDVSEVGVVAIDPSLLHTCWVERMLQVTSIHESTNASSSVVL